MHLRTTMSRGDVRSSIAMFQECRNDVDTAEEILPYYGLISSVLLTAVKDFIEYSAWKKSGKKELSKISLAKMEKRQYQLKKWFDDCDAVLGFSWCCSHLGLNKELVRSRIEELGSVGLGHHVHVTRRKGRGRTT